MKLKDCINEQVIWDKGNSKALESYYDDEPDERFKIVVNEPFEFETTNPDDYYVLKQILYKADANFDYSTEKI